MAKFTSWSLSRLGDYEQCPRRAEYKHLKKVPEGEPGPALARGSAIHSDLEMAVTGRRKVDSDEVAKVQGIVQDLNRLYKLKKVRVELELGFTKDWRLTEWFGKDTFLRVKADVLVLRDPVQLIDWKTGGKVVKGEMVRKPEYEDQLELYGIAALSAGYGSERAEGLLIFTDHGKEVKTAPVEKKDLPKLKKKWEKRILPMFKDETFAPRPGVYCKWCAYSTNKGGDCEF